MEREDRKKQLVRAKLKHLNKRVRDWEIAIEKTEGRKPNRNDMKVAPASVQEAYRDFVKIRKYLEELEKCGSGPKKNTVALTPGKIFLGTHRQQLQRSHTSYLTRSPAVVSSKLRQGVGGPSPPTAATLGLRSSKCVSLAKNNSSNSKDEKDSQKHFQFKKLFNLSKKEDGPAQADGKKHNVISVKLADETVAERRVLIPNRFSKQNNISNVIEEVDDKLDPFTNDKSMDSPDENIETKVKSSIRPHQDNISRTSPISKRQLSFRSSRPLDKGWLARLNEPEEKEEGSSENFSIGQDTSSNLNLSENSIASVNGVNNSCESLSFGEDSLLMEVDTECISTIEKFADSSYAPITHENSDSGICLNMLFNSNELEEAVQEVIAETKGQNSVSDADGSMCYFSEDACLPSCTETEDELSNNHTISGLIKSLSDNINQDEEASKSTDCSSIADLNSQTKRKACFAFTPSPEKPTKGRKFFKSTRGERVSKVKYSGASYKPISPVKKAKNAKATRIPKTTKKVTPRRVTRSAASGKRSAFENESESNEHVRKTTSISDNSCDSSNVTDNNSSPEIKRKTRPRKKVNHFLEEHESEETCETKPASVKKKNIVVDVFNETQPIQLPKRKSRKRVYNYNRADKIDALESKVSKGKLNENYVRIDTKRKVFVRGHRKIAVGKMKRLDWKQRISAASKEAKTSSFTCNKCGEKGHFAKFCMKDTTIDECPAEQDDSPFPSLEEAARMVWGNKSSGQKRVNIYSSSTSTSQNCSEESSLPVDIDVSTEEPTLVLSSHLIESVEPVFDNETSSSEFEEEAIQEALRAFGYDSFRPGQQEAVSRVLKGLSTLLILSTGSGKSLCYQLPAYMYGNKYPGALTLCISPLVSLMEDQIQGLPTVLNAACLHSGMTPKQKSVVLEKVKSKKLHVLLVSPEAVCGGLFGLLRGDGDVLPTISFACIDEVHCVSQWSHNFRPSYLQLCKILRDKLGVKTILGLTATATKTTANSICEHLNIHPSTTIRGELIPMNLNLSVSRDIRKDEALINLMRGDRFRDCDSIIIYCTRREECERVAAFVRTQLQEIPSNKIIKTKSGARLSGNCEAYHAGMTSRRRKNVQNGFMSGDIRIVVATVAFGMGIDKSDIRAVIHYNMPSAFESYVQEIGRAGRDGLPAHCHLFLDSVNKNDLNELKRHVYANSVDRPTIRKLLRKVFQSCKCKRIEDLKGVQTQDDDRKCSGHEVSFSIEDTVADLDLPQENITTLLCYLELHEKKWIEMLPLTYETCKIQSYGGPKIFKPAAARCPPLAVAIAMLKEKKRFRETDPYLEFNVIEAAAIVGWNSGVVKKELKNLEWTGSQFDDKGNSTRFRRSGLLVEFSNLAYRVKSPGSLADEDANEVLNELHGRNVRQEQTQLYQLHRVYQALMSVSLPNVDQLCDSYEEEKSDNLKKFIYEYFIEDDMSGVTEFSTIEERARDNEKIEDIRRSVRHLVDSSKDVSFTSRAIARIFQGISSPCFPADVWYRNREFWRRYLDVDFHLICRIAAEEL